MPRLLCRQPRYRSQRWVSIPALAIALVTGLSSCQTVSPQIIAVDLRATEKDVLVCSVEVGAALPPEGYMAWTERHLLDLGSCPSNPFYEDTPVYELIYAFHDGRHQLATVEYRADKSTEVSPARPLKYIKTNVYHDRDLFSGRTSRR